MKLPMGQSAVQDGNGGDDFTFEFPKADRWYRVFGFGFDMLDNSVTENETLTIYDDMLRPLGRLDLSQLEPLSARGDGFVGFVSETPIGYASFDESEASDEIGLAGFVFGYRELDAPSYPPSAWAALVAGLCVVLLVEARLLPRAPQLGLGLGVAAVWLLCLTLLAVFNMLLLWALRSWRQAALLGLAFVLNGLLSADNLFVFMLLLQKVGLPRAHHVKAISCGSLLALCVRTLLVVTGAALLQHFSWLILVVAAFLMAAGLKILCCDDTASGGSSAPREPASPGGLSRLWVVRCVGSLVPLVWDDSTGAAFTAYDDRGRLCATRLLVAVVGICLCDGLFAMDSVPAVLSVSSSPFLLVASQALSLLQLRAVYFLLEAAASYLDSMQHVLAVVLILISLKVFLEAAGFTIPLALFAGALVCWRILAMVLVLSRPWCRTCSDRTMAPHSACSDK